MLNQQPPVREEQLANPLQTAQAIHWASEGEAVDTAGIIINISSGGMVGEEGVISILSQKSI